MFRLRVSLIAALACRLLPVCAAQSQVAVDYLSAETIQKRLQSVPRKSAERREVLESLFREAGCQEQLKEQPVRHAPEPNVICTLRGTGAGEIVVGGHVDKVEQGTGAVDDWSGASLLPSLFQGLKDRPRRHTFVFVGFASEEVGLVGSTAYVRSLSPEARASTRAMLNLECLGLASPKVWASRADKGLLSAYMRVAAALKIPAEAVNVERLGDDDSHPFLNARIPVLTIHSVTTDNFPILHSQRDRLAAIHPGDYYASYKLAATLLVYLDSALE